VLAFAPWPPLAKAMIQALPLILLCFWVMHRPDMFGIGWSLVLGLVIDMLSGQTIGINAFSFLIADFALRTERGFFHNHSFLMAWIIASFVIAGVSLLPWIMAAMAASAFSEFGPVALRIAFAVLFFPVIAGALYRFQPMPQGRF
jgi:rod shape-determining protein MreD